MTYTIVAAFPFDVPAGTPPAARGTRARSTREALERVEFASLYDLAHRRAYDGADIQRMFLVRKDVHTNSGPRPAILVFDAVTHERQMNQTDQLDESDAEGFLRPVQRYVLEAGLRRAREIHEQVFPRWREVGELWGFVHIRNGTTADVVSLTPPILEELPSVDWGKDRRPEFIVCDGNHRVVYNVWNHPGRAIPAVTVRGELPEPYYAEPIGRFEWAIAADNVVTVTPDKASKYTARAVDLLTLGEDARRKLAGIPCDQLFRRYFRDLTTGFGAMGGQGGQ